MNIVECLRAWTQGPRGQPACPETTGSVPAQRQPRGGSEGGGPPGFLVPGGPRLPGQAQQLRLAGACNAGECGCGWTVQSQVCTAVGHRRVPRVPVAESPWPLLASPTGRARVAVPEHRPTSAFGFSCPAGNSSDNMTQAPGSSPAPGPEQPASPAETRAFSPGPQGPRPRPSLAGAVTVLCEIEKVAVAVQRRFLQQESIPESSLYLGQPSCSASDRNGTHVFLAAGWSECGTLVHSVRPGSGRGGARAGRPSRGAGPGRLGTLRPVAVRGGAQHRRKP